VNKCSLKGTVMKFGLLHSKNKKPLLKKYGQLNMSDFEYCPIWIGCHVTDYNEPWYNETDEETFRPWKGLLPVSPENGVFLLITNFLLADGTVLQGFISPKKQGNSNNLIQSTQPQILHSTEQQIAFWFGCLVPPDDYINQIYFLLNKSHKEIFPIKFEAKANLSTGITSGTIWGFYYLNKNCEICLKK